MTIAGFALCLIYLGLTAVALIASAKEKYDAKGRFVLRQGPIVLQLALLEALGLRALLKRLTWFSGYALIVPPTLAALYGIGWLMEKETRLFMIGVVLVLSGLLFRARRRP